jgi:glycosyltransferase involved in cell wall biosynthesis
VRILVVSRAWPSSEHSGVSLAAAAHVEMLVELGHVVSIAGASATVLRENLPVERCFHVSASGSGALYSPAKVNRMQLAKAISEAKAELVVVEAWQTALTDAAVEVAFDLGLPVLMVSHGVSLHPFSARWPDRLRALGWSLYRFGRLPRLVSKLSVLTTLAEQVASSRFYDRDLAFNSGIPVVSLANFPNNWSPVRLPHARRKKQVLVIGYFSPVKNQLAALNVLDLLPADISLRFVGPRTGSYYAQCVRRTEDMGLVSRVIFSEDHECDLAQEIAISMAVLSTSITEALPICLLEAMACGTPFVATPVGAVPSLGAGLVRADAALQAEAILALSNTPSLWELQSQIGFTQFSTRFSKDKIREQLAVAVSLAHGMGSRRQLLSYPERHVP